ncbi:hypothetical protein M430DRAFT_204184 [Amorphotheca resinae ATCC 22711]|uniref:PH domain-containing protein n=1 Tax=Amorphotheca resinae ATCC 22711 TaxID=857342 RepID=A0A2T3BBD6_AMORE|nr:hypothetical protein M430DRAFT_204184 [Amorphotheca resinae ATCC 22711]PSS25584.1 hypothetical protein M430DRAFT_204184 [Amorphotheca resinae ATCC 22711]
MSKPLTPEKDGLGAFQAFHSTFAATHRLRHSPSYSPVGGEELVPAPLKPHKLQRSQSRGGLRAMFTRNKSESSAVPVVVEEESLPPRRSSEGRITPGATLSRTGSGRKTAPRLTPAAPPPPKLATKTSRLNLRSRSMNDAKAVPMPPPQTPKPPPRPAPARTCAAWDPPPLFQAYAQAIKHAQLSASTLSADAILRLRNHKRNNSLRGEDGRRDGEVQGQAAARRNERARSKHRRQLSGSMSRAEWTEKVFVLVPSGYLLQYSGEGAFDRLPEKMLQLGKDSVAFASDVIPGRHWVLQISQSMDADGTPAADSRSLLSRLTFRGAEYRRTATSFLLVLDSAEEMDSWIAAVRREIEALGGKRPAPETGRHKPDEKVVQLKKRPSRGFLARRNPDPPSLPSTPLTPSFAPPPWRLDDDPKTQLKGPAAVSAAQPPPSPGTFTDHRSISNSFTSQDGRHLETLQEVHSRLSYMSSGQPTLITSQDSSAASSPTRESVSSLDDCSPKLSDDEVRPRPNGYAINERRRSMQTMQIVIPGDEQSGSPHPHVSSGGPGRSPRNDSPTRPNFSVPMSSSRYCPAKSSTNEAAPPPPTPVMLPVTPSQTMLKGTRKAPPAALDVARSLSPVRGSPSPERTSPLVHTPTNPSFRKLQGMSASTGDLSPRSLNPPTPTEHPQRRSSLVPLDPGYMSRLDFQFHRPDTSMGTLHEAPRSPIEEPSRPAPLPPADVIRQVPVPSNDLPDENTEPQAVTPVKKQILSPFPTPPKTSPKKPRARRPISLQRPLSIQRPISAQNNALAPQQSTRPPSTQRKPVRATRLSPKRLAPSPVLIGTPPDDRPLAPAPIMRIPPNFERLKTQPGPKLSTRKSMPTLVNGPPPAPPPECALPPLPPGIGGRRSARSSRGTIRV